VVHCYEQLWLLSRPEAQMNIFKDMGRGSRLKKKIMMLFSQNICNRRQKKEEVLVLVSILHNSAINNCRQMHTYQENTYAVFVFKFKMLKLQFL
jgi:hypothetical protein